MAHEITGVDGFLIGRGIWGRPWKLKEMEMHAQGLEYEMNLKDVLGYAIKHFEYMMEYYGKQGLFIFRKHLPFYLRGFEGASSLREKMLSFTSENEIKEELVKLHNLF